MTKKEKLLKPNRENKGKRIMGKPLVTAIITTHNRLELVQKAIISVKNQTYHNIELIVVDDASSYKTPDVLTNMSSEKEFRYIYISQNESRGGNHARNMGILASHGKYVAFLDDDDEWFPEKIAKQVDMLQIHPESRVCYCGKVNDYNFGERQKQCDTSSLLDGDLSKEIFIKWQMLSSEMMVEKALLLEVDLFDESLRFWQDYELCMRLFQKTKVCVVRENLVLYRIIQADKQRLTNKIDGWEDAVDYICKKHKAEMDQLSLKDRRRRDYYWNRDGASRSKACGDRKTERKYLWKVFLATKNPKDLVKAILNIYSFREKA